MIGLTRALAASALLGTATHAQLDAFVVDVAGSGDFLDIQDAIDVADERETILVRPGVYAPFSVDGKSLTIQADGSGVSVQQPIFFSGTTVDVRNLGTQQSVTLRGIQVDRFAGAQGGPAFRVTGCSGPVLLEECSTSPVETSDFGGALLVDSAFSVTLSRCELGGGNGYPAPGGVASIESPCVVANHSNLYVYESVLDGGPGNDQGFDPFGGVTLPPGPGGRGIVLNGGFALVSGSEVRGGDGGALSTTPSRAGGHGIYVDGFALVHVLDSTVEPGAGSPGSTPYGGPTGGPAVGTWVEAGLHVPVPGDARGYDVDSPVRSGQNLVETYRGEAGDLALLVYGSAPLPALYLFELHGALHVSLDFVVLPAGVVPPSGELVVQTPIGVPPGKDFARLSMQALFVDPLGALWLTGPTEVVLLDASL